MRVTQLNFMPSSALRHKQQAGLGAMIAAGEAIEVTHLAGNQFQAGRVAIESSVFERHVAWPNSAMRSHGIHLEEGNRLSELLHAAAQAKRHESPAEFSHRVLATDDVKNEPTRHAFVLERFDEDIRTGWLIRQ